MTDEQIIQLFWNRFEDAIPALLEKYGSAGRAAARRILPDERDIEECVNDASLRVWNAIPPERPRSLAAYLVSIVRNLALDRYHYDHAQKRSTALSTAFEELEGILFTDQHNPEQQLDANVLHDVLNRFLRKQSREARTFFLRHYWYGETLEEVAASCHVRIEKVKSSVYRTRNKLREELRKEGIVP